MHEHSRSLGHVPLIDHNARGGEKEQFEPADAVRYKERTVAERSNARLKDEFGGRNIRVRGLPGQGDVAHNVRPAGADGGPADAPVQVTEQCQRIERELRDANCVLARAAVGG